jgi:hypothetical protein
MYASCQFLGVDNELTPVAPSRQLLMIINAITDGISVQFRMHCCELLCRVFAGDPNLKDRIWTTSHR